jgi:8-hydroxy-5-deazaflavin:NADPH oxidoreductase
MKIGIIGTGNMGRVLGGLWAVAGHEVFFGARSADAAQDAKLRAERNGAGAVFAGGNAEAAAFGDVLVYSPRGVAPADVVADITAFDGKVVIDLNNHSIPNGFAFEPVVLSLAERLQAELPKAHVVKAFNTMAQEVFDTSADELVSAKVAAYIATDHEPARKAVEALARDLHLTPINAGPLRNARLLESAGDLIRFLIMRAGMGPMATFSIAVLPPATRHRFGDRTPSKLDLQADDIVDVQATAVIEASVERVWSEVANFNNVAAWHPDVTESQLLNRATGTKPGDIRSIRLRDGTALKERLVALDPDSHSYTYSVLDGQLPLSEHTSTLTMRSLDRQRTEVTWTARFRAVGAPRDVLAQGVRTGVLELGLQGLAKKSLVQAA